MKFQIQVKSLSEPPRDAMCKVFIWKEQARTVKVVLS